MRRIAALAHHLVWLFAVCTPAASAQLEQRASVRIQDPGPIAVADFNGDGKLDLATVNAFATQVAVLLGNGNGTFRTPVYYTAGDNPVSIAAADLNHDGKPDLVVGNYLSNNISVLLGNGDGTFQAPANYTIPDDLGSAIYVGVGDFNNDGNPDIIVIDSGRCTASHRTRRHRRLMPGVVSHHKLTRRPSRRRALLPARRGISLCTMPSRRRYIALQCPFSDPVSSLAKRPRNPQGAHPRCDI